MLQARVLELDEASETVRSESVSTGPERDSRSREKTAPARPVTRSPVTGSAVNKLTRVSTATLYGIQHSISPHEGRPNRKAFPGLSSHPGPIE